MLALLDWAWIAGNVDLIGQRTWEHLFLTLVPMGLGLALAFPLAVGAVHWPRLYSPLLGVTGILFTIPSIALFILLMPFTGLSRWTAIIPLTIYTLLILLRNTVEGLNGVSPEIREAAEAMGYRRLTQLLTVELPLALPVIIAGIRIAMVTTIGLVVVTAVIGQGGLGRLIFDGFVMYRDQLVLIGFLLCVVLAVVADLTLAGVQRLLTPWTRRAA